MNSIKDVPKEKLVYADESGINEYLYRGYVWSSRGKQVYGAIPERRYVRESFIAAKVGDKILSPFCYQGTCNTALFNTWIEKILTPDLQPAQVVIMDYATFHKSSKTKDLIEKAGCQILFLPPYSPDLNPIEKFWANFKRKVREIVQQFKTLSEAIDHVFLLYVLN